MTMDFTVDPAVSLETLSDGQEIHFAMVETDQGWVIEQVHVMAAESPHQGHDHD